MDENLRVDYKFRVVSTPFGTGHYYVDGKPYNAQELCQLALSMNPDLGRDTSPELRDIMKEVGADRMLSTYDAAEFLRNRGMLVGITPTCDSALEILHDMNVRRTPK